MMWVLPPRCKAPRVDRDHPAQVPAWGLPLPGQEAPQQPGSVGQGLLPSSGHGRQSHGDWRPRPSPCPGFGGSRRWPTCSPQISEVGVWPQDPQDCGVPVLAGPQGSRCGWVADGRTFVRGFFSVRGIETVCFPRKGPMLGQQGPGLSRRLCSQPCSGSLAQGRMPCLPPSLEHWRGLGCWHRGRGRSRGTAAEPQLSLGVLPRRKAVLGASWGFFLRKNVTKRCLGKVPPSNRHSRQGESHFWQNSGCSLTSALLLPQRMANLSTGINEFRPCHNPANGKATRFPHL